MKKNGIHAFPRVLLKHNEKGIIEGAGVTPGMTLRDYFAGQVITGSLIKWNLKIGDGMKEIAKISYELADEMIKAREK